MKVCSKLNIVYALFIIASISGCSQSGRRNASRIVQSTSEPAIKQNLPHDSKAESDWHGKTIINLKENNGVLEVPIKINGVQMYFIFDTGAGMVSISETEALFLYKQGLLTKGDILGSANFVDANGNISEGTIINLKTVQIGNRTLHNIKASVVHNLKAPLLLGQSVLKRFGRVTIDYDTKQIILE